jgi:hypothetical protein
MRKKKYSIEELRLLVADFKALHYGKGVMNEFYGDVSEIAEDFANEFVDWLAERKFDKEVK